MSDDHIIVLSEVELAELRSLLKYADHDHLPAIQGVWERVNDLWRSVVAAEQSDVRVSKHSAVTEADPTEQSDEMGAP